MTRMARVALAAILTVSAAWSQADPFLGGGGGAGAGGGEHPGGAGAGDPGLLTRPDFDAVLGADDHRVARRCNPKGVRVPVGHDDHQRTA